MALAADCIVITGPPAISTAADIARGTTIMAQPLKVTNASTMASSGLRGTVGAYYNVVRPDNGPEWELCAQAQFLFPR